MKILQLGPVPKSVGGKSTGGVATHTWNLSKALDREGHEVCIFADNVFNYWHTYKQQAGVNISGFSASDIIKPPKKLLSDDVFKILKWFDMLSITESYKYVLYMAKLNTIVEEFNPDIIHTHHLRYRFPVAWLITDIPLVSTIHSFHDIDFTKPQRSNKMKALFQKNIKACKHGIFVSSDLKKECENRFKNSPRNSVIIPNPVELKNYKYDGKPPKNYSEFDHNVLFVGSLSNRKGVMELLEAARLIGNDRNVGFHIIGEGVLEKKVVEKIRNDNLINTRFYGYVDDISKYYEHADLFVLPSKSESFGLVYVEAMASGTPVIGTQSIPKEVIPSEEVGYRIKKPSPKSLNNHICDALTKEWRTDIIINHAESFKWENMITKYTNVYINIYNE